MERTVLSAITAACRTLARQRSLRLVGLGESELCDQRVLHAGVSRYNRSQRQNQNQNTFICKLAPKHGLIYNNYLKNIYLCIIVSYLCISVILNILYIIDPPLSLKKYVYIQLFRLLMLFVFPYFKH
jgi:hypothetical protein